VHGAAAPKVQRLRDSLRCHLLLWIIRNMSGNAHKQARAHTNPRAHTPHMNDKNVLAMI